MSVVSALTLDSIRMEKAVNFELSEGVFKMIKGLEYFVGLLSGIVTLVAGTAHAGTASGKVAHLYTRWSDGLMLVVLTGGTTGSPSCATQNYFIIRDEHSDAGKSQYAMLMAAFLAGRTVTITGLNTCNRWGDGEDIETVAYFQ